MIETDLTAREDFDPRFYESLGTQRPQCRSRFGGQTTGADHDHHCEFDAAIDDYSGLCCEYVRGVDPATGSPIVVKQTRAHECHCGQAYWRTGQMSVGLDGSTIVG